MKRAVCLISGGMDSFVASAIAKSESQSIYALTVNYGQKNSKELSAAAKISEFLKAERHLITDADLSWAKSSLTDSSSEIPAGKSPEGIIPSTYVPARNTILISLAAAFAETVSASSIYTGVNSVDFSGYPDCRPEYIQRFQALLDTATKTACSGGKIIIMPPLLHMSKPEIIRKGISLGLDFSITWTCYKNGEKPCRTCPSCKIREQGFKDAGINDPLLD